jgi:tRNA 2-thiouridine synthesizing protein B
MILHTVNKSVFTSHTLNECLLTVARNDGVLLIEDGVYGALKTAHPAEQHEVSWYVLKEDLQARGIAPETCRDGITLVDYTGFVELTEQYASVCSWF